MKKWIVLAGYCLICSVNQMLWITFAPVATDVAGSLHTTANAIGFLAVIFPFIYILTAIPAGFLIDKNMRLAIGLGGSLSGFFAIGRLFAHNLPAMLVMQAGIALAQPLINNGITKIAAAYFPPDEHVLATGIGSASLFLGVFFGILISPFLLNMGGLFLLLSVQAAFSAAGAIFFWLVTAKPGEYPVKAEKEFAVRQLLKNPVLIRLSIIIFVGMGFFNAIATWLETLLSPFGISTTTSGILNAVMIIFGIIGAIFLPGLVERKKIPGQIMSLALLICSAGVLILFNTSSVIIMNIVMAVMGFFLLANLPIILSLVEQLAGPEKAGTAVGILMLSGNAGGVVLTSIVQLLIGREFWWPVGLLALINLLCIYPAWKLNDLKQLPETGCNHGL